MCNSWYKLLYFQNLAAYMNVSVLVIPCIDYTWCKGSFICLFVCQRFSKALHRKYYLYIQSRRQANVSFTHYYTEHLWHVLSLTNFTGLTWFQCPTLCALCHNSRKWMHVLICFQPQCCITIRKGLMPKMFVDHSWHDTLSYLHTNAKRPGGA